LCASVGNKKVFNVYMNLLIRNSPYYHLLKYLLFLLKHPVYASTLKAAAPAVFVVRMRAWVFPSITFTENRATNDPHLVTAAYG